jgi:hypothetical protein
MQINRQLFTHAARALAESMNPSSMVVIAREFFPSYNIYEQTGFQSSLAIPNKNAAHLLEAIFSIWSVQSPDLPVSVYQRHH